jgi:ribose 5-phosphate isomerase B
MKIAIGSDHAGFQLKEVIKSKLAVWGYEVQDFGTNSTASVDFTVYGQKVAECVAQGKADRGIVICGNGLGMSYVANKVPGIRAALANTVLLAKQSRQHGNANVLSLGGRPETGGLETDKAVEIAKTWLETEFEGGRHQRRLDLITDVEKKYCKEG